MDIPIYQPPVLLSGREEKLLAAHGKTFHFAARFFPPCYRQVVVSLYAFFRTLDDLVDERAATWQADVVRGELEAWQRWFEHGCADVAPRESLGEVMASLIQEYALPVSLFLDFLAGLLSDIEPQQMSNFHELYRYCYRVAGTVGLAMAHVLGDRSEQALMAAKDLGVAMQLTNILRDVGGDLATGRLYLPQDELAHFDLTPLSLRQLYLAQRGPDERFCALMRAQIARARRYYTAGMHGIWLLRPDCRLAILLAGRLYQGILREIERGRYDVLRKRAATSQFTKVREAGAVFLLDLLWRGGETVVAPEVVEMPFWRGGETMEAPEAVEMPYER
jgi:phytoene synthase